MKPTQLTELLANIKATAVSFFSILMFVALGVGVFLGISWTAPGLQGAADETFDEGNLHSFQVSFPYGLTDDDLRKLSDVEGVSKVEPGRTSFQVLPRGAKNYTVKTQSLTETIDVPFVEEGRLPRASDEVALEATWARSLGIGVGDVITFERDAAVSDDASGETGDSGADTPSRASGDPDDPDGMKLLTHDTFTVSGLVESVEYLSTASTTFGFSDIGSGSIDGIAWLAPDAYDAGAFYDGYPVVDVQSDGLAGLGTFGDAYKQASSDIQARIADLGSTLAGQRYEALHTAAAEQVEEGEARLEEARTRVTEGERKIADGERQLEDARSMVAEGERRLTEAYPQLLDYQARYDDAKGLLVQKASEYDDAKASFDAGMSLVNAAKEEAASMGREAAAERAVRDEAKSKRDAALARAQADRDASAAAAQAQRDATVKNLDADLQAGKITQAEHDAGVKEADARLSAAEEAAAAGQEQAEAGARSAYDEAVAASYARVDAKCEEMAAAYREATGDDLPFALNHENVDVLLVEVRRLLDTVDDVEIEYGGQKMTAGEAKQRLADAEKQLAQGRSLLSSAQARLDDGWAQYSSGQAQVDSGKQRISRGEAELEDARVQLEEGRQGVAGGERRLEEVKRQLGLMREYEWTVASRESNGGVQSAATFSGVTDRLRFSMAALFVIVGLLVCYSAVSRIVHEQITQIGTKKAIGFRRREITVSYLAYSGLAVLAGAIAGTVVGVFAVEGIIARALGAKFIMGAFPPYFDGVLFLAVTLLELALVLGATWLACRGILKEQAVELLKGEKPPEARERFYERWGSWERLPLFTQTIVSNCVNDKRRVFSTIVGVAGCTALIVTAITLNDDVLASYDRQYSEVFAYNATAYADDAEAVRATSEALESMGADSTAVLRHTFGLRLPDGGQSAVAVTVPADEGEFAAYYRIPAAADGLGDDGVWMSQAYSSHMGAKVGDEVVVDGGDGAVHRFSIKGFFPYYLANNEMVVPKALYEADFAETLSPNALLVDTNGRDVDSLEESLRAIGGFDSLRDTKAADRASFDDFSSVSRTVVLIYLALSVLMAIVVLLNLNVMFIEEKKRDLIVLMINGFGVGDAKRYIYNDTIVLTVLGIILGLILGGVMGYITVASVEPGTASFVKDVDAVAMLVGLGGSAVLATIMSLISLRRIPAFDLTDINKF